MPVKTARKMAPDELLQIRHILGKYSFKSGGWCRLGESADGTFFIQSQKAGEFQDKFIPCEPEYIYDQKAYFDVNYSDIASFEVKHPELQQHFTKRGKPRTSETLIEEFLDSDAGLAFNVPINVPIDKIARAEWFWIMIQMVKASNGGKLPKFTKPFSFTEWASND